MGGSITLARLLDEVLEPGTPHTGMNPHDLPGHPVAVLEPTALARRRRRRASPSKSSTSCCVSQFTWNEMAVDLEQRPAVPVDQPTSNPPISTLLILRFEPSRCLLRSAFEFPRPDRMNR